MLIPRSVKSDATHFFAKTAPAVRNNSNVGTHLPVEQTSTPAVHNRDQRFCPSHRPAKPPEWQNPQKPRPHNAVIAHKYASAAANIFNPLDDNGEFVTESIGTQPKNVQLRIDGEMGRAAM